MSTMEWSRTLPTTGVLLCILLFVAIPATSAATKTEYVNHVHQNFNDKTNYQAVQQINSFWKSVFLYTAYASYFDRADVDLPGFKKLFARMSTDSVELALNLTEVVNQRGGHVFFQNIKLRQVCKTLPSPKLCPFLLNNKSSKVVRPQAPYKRSQKKYPKYSKKGWNAKRIKKAAVTPVKPNALDALHETLAQERKTNENLLDLMNIVDPGMKLKVDNYLELQVDIIFELTNLISRMEMYQKTDQYELGEYILDSEIQYLKTVVWGN